MRIRLAASMITATRSVNRVPGAPARRQRGIAYAQIGAAADLQASVPAAPLRSRRIRITGSGAGSAPVAAITAQRPAYLQLIPDGRVQVPTQAFPLSHIAKAWTAAHGRGPVS